MCGVFRWWKPCQWIAALVPPIILVTSTTMWSFTQTCIDGPGIFLFILMTPRSIPSTVTHCSLKQSLTFPLKDSPQVPQALRNSSSHKTAHLFRKNLSQLTVLRNDNVPSANGSSKPLALNCDNLWSKLHLKVFASRDFYLLAHLRHSKAKKLEQFWPSRISSKVFNQLSLESEITTAFIELYQITLFVSKIPFVHMR